MRPFATIWLFDQDIAGLVDTGAFVSCFFSDYTKGFLQENKNPRKKFAISLKTVDGSKHAAVGSITTDVIFRGKTNTVSFLIIQSLEQSLDLGSDFARIFGLTKDLFCETLNTFSFFSCNEITSSVRDHNFSAEQANKLLYLIAKSKVWVELLTLD